MELNRYQWQLDNLEIEFSGLVVWTRRLMVFLSVLLIAQPIFRVNEFMMSKLQWIDTLSVLDRRSIALLYMAIGGICIMILVSEFALMWRHKTTSVGNVHSDQYLSGVTPLSIRPKKLHHHMAYHYGIIALMDIVVPSILMCSTVVYWWIYMC